MPITICSSKTPIIHLPHPEQTPTVESLNRGEAIPEREVKLTWEDYLDQPSFPFATFDSQVPEIVNKLKENNDEKVLIFLELIAANQAQRRSERVGHPSTDGLYLFEKKAINNAYLQLAEYFFERLEKERFDDASKKKWGKKMSVCFTDAFSKTKLQDISILETFLDKPFPPTWLRFMQGLYYKMALHLYETNSSQIFLLAKVQDYIASLPQVEVLEVLAKAYDNIGSHSEAYKIRSLYILPYDTSSA